MIAGSWTELVPHDIEDHADIYRRIFDAGSQRLFAGSGIRPLCAADVSADSPSTRVGTIIRRGDSSRRPVGIFDCQLRSAGCFHLGVVLAASADWGNGVGMDAMLALLRYLFHYERWRTFEMSAGIHNGSTVRILANGMIGPEAICRDSIADGSHLRDLIVGSMTAAQFASAGYVPSGKLPSDDYWMDIRDRVLD